MEILVGFTQLSHCQFHASNPLFPHDEGSISMSLFPLLYPWNAVLALFQTIQSLQFLPSLCQVLLFAILVLAEANLKFISSDSLGACSARASFKCGDVVNKTQVFPGDHGVWIIHGKAGNKCTSK